MVTTQLGGAAGGVIGGVKREDDRVAAAFTEGEVTGDGLPALDDHTREGEVRGNIANIWCTHVG